MRIDSKLSVFALLGGVFLFDGDINASESSEYRKIAMAKTMPCVSEPLLKEVIFTKLTSKNDWYNFLSTMNNNPFIEIFLNDLHNDDQFVFLNSHCFGISYGAEEWEITFNTPRLGKAWMAVAVKGKNVSVYSFVLGDFSHSSD